MTSSPIDMNITEISVLLEDGQLNEATRLLEIYDGVRNQEFWILAAKVYTRQQNWGKTINACLKVLELEPDNTEAKVFLEIAKSILDFSNKDMLNP